MGNNKDPNQKRPGEKEPGTFHFNPGNMSGKPAGAETDKPKTDKPERQSSADAEHNHPEQEDKKVGDN